MENITIKLIEHGSANYAHAVALRKEVLRVPLGLDFSNEELAFECDQLHFAAFYGQELVAIALLVLEGQSAKMRQVAVKPTLQNQHIGTDLLNFIEKTLQNQKINYIYCHARDKAINFYVKNGYEPCGSPFIEVGIPHMKMQKIL